MSKSRMVCFVSKKPLDEGDLERIQYSMGQASDLLQGVSLDKHNPLNAVAKIPSGKAVPPAIISVAERFGLTPRRSMLFDIAASVAEAANNANLSAYEPVEGSVEQIEVPRNADGTWSFPRDAEQGQKIQLAMC